ncbi:TPA: hypothetical protein ACGO1T_000532 [Streptococcus suis]
MSRTGFLTGEGVEIADGIKLRVPKIREIIDDSSFATRSYIMTFKTREIFSTAENVDALEKKYPTVFEIMKDPQADLALGKYFGKETLSRAVIDAFEYWIYFDEIPEKSNEADDGYTLLSNGKIIHGSPEWVIDKDEFYRVANIIKEMTCHKVNDDLIAPTIKSRGQYEAWMSLYKGKLEKMKRNSLTWTDKILILSISTGAYIPIEQILDMTVFTFNKLFQGLSAKESYEKDFLTRLSPNYKVNGSLKHWQEKWKRL